MKGLSVTSVKVFPIGNPSMVSGKLKAIASITIEDQLQLTNLRLYEGERGLFVSYPDDRNGSNEYARIYYPINGGLRARIEKAVIDEYEKSIRG